MTVIRARVVADSVSRAGVRLTTMELRYPRFIHSEFMTHRVFSRNAASSRAIPVARMLAQVTDDPALPVHWGADRPGMQAREELDGPARACALSCWLAARDQAVTRVRELLALGLHKQVANRLLEPWQWIVTVVTATDWDNFYALRDHPDAQPEMQSLAAAMLAAHNGSVPAVVEVGGWHLPYVAQNHELDAVGILAAQQAFPERSALTCALACSVARCARVSTLRHDGQAPDPEADVRLHDRLLTAGHMSPFEHQATPQIPPLERSGNLRGWNQYRKGLPGETRSRHAAYQAVAHPPSAGAGDVDRVWLGGVVRA